MFRNGFRKAFSKRRWLWSRWPETERVCQPCGWHRTGAFLRGQLAHRPRHESRTTSWVDSIWLKKWSDAQAEDNIIRNTTTARVKKINLKKLKGKKKTKKERKWLWGVVGKGNRRAKNDMPKENQNNELTQKNTQQWKFWFVKAHCPNNSKYCT